MRICLIPTQPPWWSTRLRSGCRLAAALASLGPWPAAAQEAPGVIDSIALSRRERAFADAKAHAPVFYFAPSERYFPTLPFLSGFDFVDNRFGQKLEARNAPDPLELAPVQEACTVLPTLHGCTKRPGGAKMARGREGCVKMTQPAPAARRLLLRLDCFEYEYLYMTEVDSAQFKNLKDSVEVQRQKARGLADDEAKDSLRMVTLEAARDSIDAVREFGRRLSSAFRGIAIRRADTIGILLRAHDTTGLVRLGFLADSADPRTAQLDALGALVDSVRFPHDTARANRALGLIEQEVSKIPLRRQERARQQESITTELAGLDSQLVTARNAFATKVAKRPFSAVFYKVEPLSREAARTFWGQLRRDDQLWKRSRLADLYADSTMLDLTAVQFYMFYYRDEGLEGHSGDFERLVVIHPTDAAAAKRFQVIIGVGHSAITANNILVLSDSNDVADANEPSILVELGGHSNATDRWPLGSFQLGWDANWRTSEAAWGVRDVQALNGTQFLGRYQGNATIPRDTSRTVVLHERTHCKPGGPGNCYDLIALQDFRDLVIAATVLDTLRDSTAAGRRLAREDLRKRLEPFVALQQFWYDNYKELTRGENRMRWEAATYLRPAQLDRIATAIARWRDIPQLRCHRLGEEISEKSCALHESPPQEFWGPKKESEASPQDPNRLFKAYLYRPSACRLPDEGYSHLLSSVLSGTTLSYWGRPWRSDSHRASAGMLLPVLCNRLLELPGTLELQYSFGIGHGARERSLALIYDRDYFSEISWYGAVSRNWGVVPRSHLRAQVGATFQPIALFSRTWGVDRLSLAAQMIRIRAGISVGDVRGGDTSGAQGRTVDRVRVEFSLQLRLPQQMQNWSR